MCELDRLALAGLVVIPHELPGDDVEVAVGLAGHTVSNVGRIAEELDRESIRHGAFSDAGRPGEQQAMGEPPILQRSIKPFDDGLVPGDALHARSLLPHDRQKLA